MLPSLQHGVDDGTGAMAPTLPTPGWIAVRLNGRGPTVAAALLCVVVGLFLAPVLISRAECDWASRSGWPTTTS
jgi:hypothetical protein